MAAKRKTLWQILAAQLLLVAVPLYGLAPELSALASSRGDWESKTRLRVSSSALETQPQALQRFHPEIASGDSFHAEAIGTVRALTDELGNVTDRYTLEAFGTLLDHLGDDPNAYLFSGEPLDPNSGFYYNRARWLTSSHGRFLSSDPQIDLSGDRTSRHLYSYGGLDPILLVDPTGHFEGLASFLVGFGVRAIVGRAFVGAIFGTADAYLRGYSPREGAAWGAVGGVAGPLLGLRIGLAFAAYGVGEALYHQDYDSALFRAATAGFGYILQARGFRSFSAFKRVWGRAGSGRAWHHVVEQTPSNVARFGPERIHNPSNVAPLPHGRGSIHAKLSGFYSSKQPSVTGSPNLTIRQWLATKSFSEQYQFGLEAMQRFGGGGSPMDVSSATRSWAWPAVLEPFSESYSPADFFGQDEETP